MRLEDMQTAKAFQVEELKSIIIKSALAPKTLVPR